MIDIEQLLSQPVDIESELKFFLKDRSNKVILDIGSCTGEDSLRYKRLFPDATIYAFEPLPKNIEVMREHFRRFAEADSIEIITKALSDSSTTTQFYVSSGTPHPELEEGSYTSLYPKEWNKSSSLLPPSSTMKEVYPWLIFQEAIEVETITLDGFCSERKIPFIDFIHMDVQGAEMKVLLGANKMLKNTFLIWMELENVELYKDQVLANEIRQYLNKNQFTEIKTTAKGKIEGDSLFVNREYFPLSKKAGFYSQKLVNYIRFKLNK